MVMEEAIASLKSECTHEQLKTTLPLLYTYIRNIHENSTQEKYRRIRTGNAKFNQAIWQHVSCRTLLFLCGFEENGDFLVLPLGLDVSQLYSILQNVLSSEDIALPVKSPSKNVKKSEPDTLKLVPGSMFTEDVTPNMTLLSYLVEMGYPQHVSKKALVATQNKGVQPAMDWIIEHPECYFQKENDNKRTDTITSSANNQSALMGIMDNSRQEIVTSRLQASTNEKHKFQEKQRLEAIKKAKLEKEEEKRAKELLMKNLKAERQQNRVKFEQKSLIRHSVDENGDTESSKEDTITSTDPNTARIRIKTASGKRKLWTTDKNSTIKDLYSYVTAEELNQSPDFVIVRNHPRIILSKDDETTLADNGLCPNGIVVVEEPKGDAESELPTDLAETDDGNSEDNSEL